MKLTTTIFAFFLLYICNVQAQQVRFSSDFESGSLGSCALVDSVWFKRSATDSVLMLSYDVFSKPDPLNPVDTALTPSARWFYFKMEGVKGKQLHLNFHETDPLRCMYSYDNVTFDRLPICSAPERSKVVAEFEQDVVYLAYYIPYTYSHLLQRVDEWKKQPCVKHENIGVSTNGRPMPMLTITDPSVPDTDKKRIYIHGRTHTSETPASWHLDGMVSALAADSEYARAIRKSAIFYIVPFTNPDGVVEGLSRSNTNGVNLEINWARPADSTEQEVKVLKANMDKLTKDKPFDMFLNMHSQIANSATYWVHKAESTSDLFFQQEMLLCYLNMVDNPYLFKKDLSFSNVADRYPEGWVWNQWRDTTLAVTFETPYTYYNSNPDNVWVSTASLQKFGEATLQAVADYFGVSSSNRIIIDNTSAKLKGKWQHERSTGIVFFGEDCVRSQKVGAKLSYRLDSLAAGSYKVYAWKPDTFNTSEETNSWVFVQDYVQKKNGKLSLTLKADEASQLFDAILLVRQ